MSMIHRFSLKACLALLTALFVCAPLPASAASGSDAKTTVQSTLDAAAAKYDELVTKIKDELRIYKDVDVEFKDGTAHLTGVVNNREEKEEVVKRVRSVPGVQAVKDDVKVKGEESGLGAYIDDASITAGIKAAFLTEKGLDSLDISVETTDSVATLTGQVDNAAQVSLAEEIARRVNGVAKIVNKLTLKK